MCLFVWTTSQGTPRFNFLEINKILLMSLKDYVGG